MNQVFFERNRLLGDIIEIVFHCLKKKKKTFDCQFLILKIMKNQPHTMLTFYFVFWYCLIWFDTKVETIPFLKVFRWIIVCGLWQRMFYVKSWQFLLEVWLGNNLVEWLGVILDLFCFFLGKWFYGWLSVF